MLEIILSYNSITGSMNARAVVAALWQLVLDHVLSNNMRGGRGPARARSSQPAPGDRARRAERTGG